MEFIHFMELSLVSLLPGFCEFCLEQGFMTQCALKLHIKAAHYHLEKKCEHCSKEFADIYKLRRHVAGVHFKVRPYGCHSCEARFKRKDHLKEHIHNKHRSEKIL